MKEKIESVKASGFRVFKTSVAGIETIYRNINRKELRDMQKKIVEKTEQLRKANQNISDAELQAQMKEDGEELLILRAVLQPVMQSELDLHALPAGFVQVVSELVMTASGFGEQVEPQEL